MKKILLFWALFSSITAFAQYPDLAEYRHGQVVWDHNFKDVEGNYHNLYSQLNEGKIGLFFSLRSYGFGSSEPGDDYMYNYIANTIQPFYNQYGPLGTSKIFSLALHRQSGFITDTSIFSIVPTSFEDNSVGNWLEIIDMPLSININDYDSTWLKWDGTCYETLATYAQTSNPTWWGRDRAMYLVCPDKSSYMFSTPFPDADSLAGLLDALCPGLTNGSDGRLSFYTLDTLQKCYGESIQERVYLVNMGTEQISTADLHVVVNEDTIQTIHWSGNLNSYEMDTLQMERFYFKGVPTNIQLQLHVNDDANLSNNVISRSIKPAIPINPIDTIVMRFKFTDDAYTNLAFCPGVLNEKNEVLMVYGFSNFLKGKGEFDGTQTINSTLTPLDEGGDTIMYLPTIQNQCYVTRALSNRERGLKSPYAFVAPGYVSFSNGESANEYYYYGNFGRRVEGKYSSIAQPDAWLGATYIVHSAWDSLPNGSIEVLATGGVPDYSYSSHGVTYDSLYESDNILVDLSPGKYAIATKDIAGYTIVDTILVPNQISLQTAYTVSDVFNTQLGSIEVHAQFGIPPYQYSINCGSSYQSDSLFSDLSPGWYCVSTQDATGNVVTDSVEVQFFTQTVELNKDFVKIYPNPTNSSLFVEATNLDTKGVIIVCDMLGREVHSFTLDNNGAHTLQVDTWPSGRYQMLSVVKNTRRHLGEFVVEH